MAGPSRIDYGSQVRLFALLLFLFLLILLLGSTYLFGQSRNRLELEMERGLLLATRAASDRLAADAAWRERADPERLAAGTEAALEGLRAEAGLSRLVVWDFEGRRRVFGAQAHLPPGVMVDPALRDGRPVHSDFFPGEAAGSICWKSRAARLRVA